jgi:hypothetical protein
MTWSRRLAAISIAALALGGCSSGSSAPSGPSSPPTGAGTAARTPTGASTGAATDSQQKRIKALETEGGVSSTVIRLSAAGTVAPVRTFTVPVGQTLRLIVVSPTATHLIGKGVGVDIDVPAGNPTAIDVVAFTAGSYTITTRAGATIAKLRVGS